MVAQNPNVSFSRAKNSPGFTDVKASSTASLAANQMSFEVQEPVIESMTTESALQHFGVSPHAPNRFSFQKAASAPADLASLAAEIQPLLKQQETLTRALQNWKSYGISGMTQLQARQALRKISRTLEPLLQSHNQLQQQRLEMQKEGLSQAVFSDLLSRYASQDLSMNDVRDMSSPKAQALFDVIDYYTVNQSLESIARDPDAPQLDVQKGMDLVYARLMANFVEKETNAAAELLFSQLAENPHLSLSTSQEALLEAYGIVPNGQGQLTNYASGELVSAADFDDFNQILAYQKAHVLGAGQSSAALSAASSLLQFTGMQGAEMMRPIFENPEVQQLTESARMANGTLGRALLAKQHLESQGQILDQALAAAKAERSRLENQKNDLLKGLSAAEEQLEATTQEQGVVQEVAAEVQDLETESDVVSYLKGVSLGKRSLLEGLGIKLEGSDHRGWQVSVAGQPWRPGAGRQFLGQRLQEKITGLDLRIESLRSQTQTLQTQYTQVDAALQDAEKTTQNLEVATQDYERAFDVYETEIDALRALRSDPEAWAALSAEEQATAEQLLADADQQAATARQRLQAAREEQKALQATLEETREVLVQAQTRLENILQGILALDAQQQILHQQVEQIAGGMLSVADEKAQALVNRAEQLSQRLTLAPDPDSEDVGALIAEWQRILKDTQAHFAQLSSALHTAQRIEKERLAHYAQEALELNAYTQSFFAKSSAQKQDYLSQMQQELQQQIQRLTAVALR